MDEKSQVANLARGAGLDLTPDRAAALVPAARRLSDAAVRLREIDLGSTEPALLFDVQAREDERER